MAAAQKFYEGQEFVSDDPAKPSLVYRGGKFFPKQDQPAGDTGTADQPFAPMTPGSDARARAALGIGPALQGQRHMFEAEGWQNPAPGQPGKANAENPLNKEWGATVLGSVDDSLPSWMPHISLDPIARAWGGQKYQDYLQASKSFEAAILPIMSGAAVTPSEAQRQIKASLPELGDAPQTLARKATNRAMMLNAAADLMGRPRPLPKVGTWDFGGGQPASQPRAGQGPSSPAAGQPPVVRSAQEAMALPPGTVFITHDGRRKVR